MCSTLAPTGTEASPEATTVPTAPPSSGAPTWNGGTYDLASFIRPRMYGSTDRTSLRTSTCPGPGSGNSRSTRRKCSALGVPLGRAARWNSRAVLVISQNPSSLASILHYLDNPRRGRIRAAGARRYA